MNSIDHGIIIIPGCTQILIASYYHSEKLFGCSISFQFLKHSRIHSNRLILIPKASANSKSKYLRIINLDKFIWID